MEVDGQRYPRDISPMNYEEHDYIEQYEDIKLFFKEPKIKSFFLSYPDMKTKYPIQIVDLTHQPDHITPATISRIWH